MDVVVIGGGIVGLASALELQSRGRLVAIVDPDEPLGRASYGNAGMLSRGSIFPVAGPGVLKKLPGYLSGRDVAVRVRLAALPSLTQWGRRFVAAANETAWRKAATALAPMVALCVDRHVALAERVGARHMIRHNGYLRLYRHEHGVGASALERTVLTEHGVRHQVLSIEEVREAEPHLAPRFGSGLLFTDTASVESPGELVAAYRRAFLADGGRIVRGWADVFQGGEDNVIVHTATGQVSAQYGVLAAGAWSARVAARLGYHIPLAAERGYHLHLKLRGNAGLNRPIFDTAGGYVMSPMDGAIRVLSGVELARPDDTPDYRQIEAVVADAQQSLPLAKDPEQKIWIGSRPSTPDGLPVIGKAARHPRLVFAFGHGHIGFANGPATGRVVAQLIAGEPLDFPIGAFDAARFGR
ncbi:FAD-binding oxidoreductase [Devosia sp. 1566]|uniref:NAD(P)/FAD-dependent oxidoreductase n=1 Tax=Devosia sp. 1566 TaxID=2499144 RepID=UPI0013E3F813|nr:FAD-binding oxidoreductase [Devosia sp. 1566]